MNLGRLKGFSGTVRPLGQIFEALLSDALLLALGDHGVDKSCMISSCDSRFRPSRPVYHSFQKYPWSFSSIPSFWQTSLPFSAIRPTSSLLSRGLLFSHRRIKPHAWMAGLYDFDTPLGFSLKGQLGEHCCYSPLLIGEPQRCGSRTWVCVRVEKRLAMKNRYVTSQ